MTTTIWQAIAFVLVVAMFATIITVVLRTGRKVDRLSLADSLLNETVHGTTKVPLDELLQRMQAAESNKQLALAEMQRIAAQLVQSDTNRRWLEKRVQQLTQEVDGQHQLLAVLGQHELGDEPTPSVMDDWTEPEGFTTQFLRMSPKESADIAAILEPREAFHGFDVDDKVQVIDLQRARDAYNEQRFALVPEDDPNYCVVRPDPTFECQYCDRRYQLKKNGRLRGHMSGGHVCPGSDTEPVGQQRDGGAA